MMQTQNTNRLRRLIVDKCLDHEVTFVGHGMANIKTTFNRPAFERLKQQLVAEHLKNRKKYNV